MHATGNQGINKIGPVTSQDWFKVKSYPFLNKTVLALVNAGVRDVLSKGSISEGYKFIDDGRLLYYSSREELRSMGIDNGTMFFILNKKPNEIDVSSPIELTGCVLSGIMSYSRDERNLVNHFLDIKKFLTPRNYNQTGVKFYWFNGEQIHKLVR